MEPRELTSSRLRSTKQKMLREADFCPSTGMQRGGKLMGSTVPVEKKNNKSTPASLSISHQTGQQQAAWWFGSQ